MGSHFALSTREGWEGATQAITSQHEAPLFLSSEKSLRKERRGEREGKRRLGDLDRLQVMCVCVGGGGGGGLSSLVWSDCDL